MLIITIFVLTYKSKSFQSIDMKTKRNRKAYRVGLTF